MADVQITYTAHLNGFREIVSFIYFEWFKFCGKLQNSICANGTCSFESRKPSICVEKSSRKQWPARTRASAYLADDGRGYVYLFCLFSVWIRSFRCPKCHIDDGYLSCGSRVNNSFVCPLWTPLWLDLRQRNSDKKNRNKNGEKVLSRPVGILVKILMDHFWRESQFFISKTEKNPHDFDTIQYLKGSFEFGW